MTESRYERGVQFLREHRGDASTDAMLTSVRARGERFAEYAIANSYGETYLRDGIELKYRELATITVIATLGGVDDQLKTHVELGLKFGLRPEEIVEAMIQVSAYAGAPRCSQAMKQVQAVFDAAGIPMP